MVHSIAGLIARGALTRARPFRAPHHSATMAALTGGGTRVKPGEARCIQADRAAAVAGRPDGPAAAPLNARAEGRWLEEIVALDEPAKALITRAAEASGLAARGWTRTLRLARTIADLEAAPTVRRVHVAEALIYRRIGPTAEGVNEAPARFRVWG